MFGSTQTLHPYAQVGSFVLYNISLGLKVEDAEGREKDGDEHYSTGKQSHHP